MLSEVFGQRRGVPGSRARVAKGRERLCRLRSVISPDRSPRRARHFAALGLALALAAHAERLPVKLYDTSDGLAGDAVQNLFRDSRGFLWIATSSGLSRFDGQLFRNYEAAEGLPSPRVHDVVEGPDGSIWVATARGVARLAPDADAASGPFVVEPLPGEIAAAHRLAFDATGILWIGGDRLFRLDPSAAGKARLTTIELPVAEGGVEGLALGGNGDLWIATWEALLLRRADGSFRRYEVGGPVTGASMVAVDARERLWVGGPGGLFVVAAAALRAENAAAPTVPARSLHARSRPPAFPGEMPGPEGEVLFYSAASGLADDFLYMVKPDGGGSDGKAGVWVGTRGGVTLLRDGSARTIGVAQGLAEGAQMAVLEDLEGTLWLGSESRGLSRLRRSGFVAYAEADGLSGDRATTLFDSPGGELQVVTWSKELHAFDGRRFERITPQALFPRFASGWGWNQFALFDRRGALWYPAHGALSRFAPVTPPGRLREATPERQWTPQSGLPGPDVFRVFEDRRGDVWVSLIATPPLVKLVGGERLEPVPEIQGGATGGAPTAFAEDRAGNLWMGFYVGGLARVRDGVFTFFGEPAGVPPGFVSDLFLDHAGRLWVATTSGGIARVDQPEAAAPLFRRYRTSEGLTTDSTRCVTEDRAGRIYVGTSRGIDRIDLPSGRVRAYSADDGLPNNLVFACHAGDDGRLWFGTLHGLARFDPAAETPPGPPDIVITAVRIAGQRLPLPDLGLHEVGELRIAPDRNSLQIDYTGVAIGAGHDLRFQYRVLASGAAGAADDGWSPPSPARSAQFPRLGSGTYRFEVRALNRDGTPGLSAASVAFRILPPFWQEPWFLAAAAALLALLGWFGLRIRVARLLAVERARTRIASDLHDDVGSSISRIGILGELARQRVQASPVEAEEMLGEIGREARELVEATSDIVWAVDPHRDDLQSLVVRLRRFAVDLLEARGVELAFTAPAEAEGIALPPEARRAFYLCLKEAIHNVAKHSTGKRARVSIALRDGRLQGEVSDDGGGIPSGRAAEAEAVGRRGLPGLHRRAESAGGEVEIESVPGQGTRVVITLPLRAGRTSRQRSHDRATGGDGGS